jgi:hypothetical protein
MARYTYYYLIRAEKERLPDIVAEVLQDCTLSITYKSEDYVMAQEPIGQKPFNQLVKVEVLIHKSDMDRDKVKLTCVTKNGELQLQSQNHCQHMALKLQEVFRHTPKWQFVEQLNG